MALGDVERTCEAGACRSRAIYIGSFTDQLQQARTTAACCEEHVVKLEHQHTLEGYKITWRAFPARPAVTELGEAHAPSQS